MCVCVLCGDKTPVINTNSILYVIVIGGLQEETEVRVLVLMCALIT